jgi:molybdopterin synthase sulfur carrier subunit
MEIECRFFATFREAAGGKTLALQVDPGTTVGEVLARLEAEYGMELLEDGEIRERLSVLKNGREVVHMDAAATPLSDGDELSVFPPIAGGIAGRVGDP